MVSKTGEESGRKWASNDDWTRIRPVFTQLYQGKKLREVKQILEEEHDFYATPRMYKTRIKEWGLGKNLQADHILSVLYSQQQRSLEHKASEFTVRGVKVDPRKIRMYLKRKPDLIKRFEDGACPSVLAAGEVAFRTPSPSPPTTTPEEEPNKPPAPMPVFGTTMQQALYERITVYTDNLFPLHVWDDAFLGLPTTSVRPFNDLDDLTFLWNHLIVPKDRLVAHRFSPLRSLIDLNDSPLPEVLRREPPMLLSWALGQMAYFDHIACQALLREFMACLVQLTQSSLGVDHRLEAIWRQAFDILQAGRSRDLDRVYCHAMREISRSRNVGEGIVVDGVKELHHLWRPSRTRSLMGVQAAG